MVWPIAIVLLVAATRLLELFHAKRNETRLQAEGFHEVGAGHYPMIVLLHVAWLLSLAILTILEPTLIPAWLVLFLSLQVGRAWVLVSLGRYWTTRVWTKPGSVLVRHGPYRWIRHPNYLVVALEIPVLSFALGADLIGVVFGLLNAGLLYHRIKIEETALTDRPFSSSIGSKGTYLKER